MLPRLIALALVVACFGCINADSPHSQSKHDKLEIDTADTDISELATEEIYLDRVIAVPESEFLRILSTESHKSAEPKDRESAVSYSAMANAKQALGVVGELSTSLSVAETTTLVVMRNPKSTENGLIQSTDFYFASIMLPNGIATWGLKSLRLLLTKPIDASCSNETRGCHPVPPSSQLPLRLSTSNEGGAGLSAGVTMNAEGPTFTTNASGHSIQLVSYPPSELELPANAFLCIGPLLHQDCIEHKPEDAPVTDRANKYMAFPADAILVSDRDFGPIRKRGRGRFEDPCASV